MLAGCAELSQCHFYFAVVGCLPQSKKDTSDFIRYCLVEAKEVNDAHPEINFTRFSTDGVSLDNLDLISAQLGFVYGKHNCDAVTDNK